MLTAKSFPDVVSMRQKFVHLRRHFARWLTSTRQELAERVG
jgi:hypothetical protein